MLFPVVEPPASPSSSSQFWTLVLLVLGLGVSMMKTKGPVVSRTFLQPSWIPAGFQNPPFPLTPFIGGYVLFMFRAQLRPASPVVKARVHALVPLVLIPGLFCLHFFLKNVSVDDRLGGLLSTRCCELTFAH